MTCKHNMHVYQCQWKVDVKDPAAMIDLQNISTSPAFKSHMDYLYTYSPKWRTRLWVSWLAAQRLLVFSRLAPIGKLLISSAQWWRSIWMILTRKHNLLTSQCQWKVDAKYQKARISLQNSFTAFTSLSFPPLLFGILQPCIQCW